MEVDFLPQTACEGGVPRPLKCSCVFMLLKEVEGLIAPTVVYSMRV